MRIGYVELRQTGMALRASKQAQWKQKIVKLEAGYYLILHTDGIIYIAKVIVILG
jgi:serine phosphatase RsbU (regulator of sigma subunit)